MAIIKYVQSQYEAKIAELEQYYILLQQHLNKMENLKENMFQFWDDDNARQAGQVLPSPAGKAIPFTPFPPSG